MLETLTQQLNASRPLSEQQISEAVADLVNETISVQTKAEFLASLARKGETAEEIAAFARALRSRCVRPPIQERLRTEEILDIVGTGGDHLSTFNISSTVALVAAAAGVRVAKHGNRASTSPVGSADVMEALGIRPDLAPEAAARSLCELNFAFFFAPHYHPAFKHIIPARKLCAQQGQATIFNFLGPLLNPAHPSAMLIGVSRPNLCLPLAQVLRALGVRRAMVVCGSVPPQDGHPLRYMDELSPLGPTQAALFEPESAITTREILPADFPLQPARLKDLHGGDRQFNAALIRRILQGQEQGPRRDAVLLNAAAALRVANRVTSFQAGWELAAQTIDSGLAFKKLQALTTVQA